MKSQLFRRFHCCFFAGAVAVAAVFPMPLPAATGVPSLDELAGDWHQVSDLRSLPAFDSPRGAAKTTDNILAVDDIGFPPVFDTYRKAVLKIAGNEVKAQSVRWYPYQVVRRASVPDQYDIDTTVSMSSRDNAVYLRLKITNTGKQPQNYPLQIVLDAVPVLLHEKSWANPRVDSSGNPSSDKPDSVKTEMRAGTLVVHDGDVTGAFAFSETPKTFTATGQDAQNTNSGEADWDLNLFPNESKTITLVYTCGTDEGSTVYNCGRLAAHADAAVAQAKADWDHLWTAIFGTGNALFPGNVPTLVTDDAALSRVYYASLVSLLSTYREGLPAQARIFTSNSPEHDCSMIYFWDTREWATVYALLDPESMKKCLLNWLRLGIHNGYSEDYISGKLQGPWYSANDYAVFLQVRTYVAVTGDRAFLKEQAGPKTVLEHLNDIALYWKTLRHPGRQLADYGGADNLLECVPTYINEVPSFNAADVWMMREVATLDDMEGRSDLSKEPRAEAAALLPNVLALYEPGKGVWNSLHNDGSRVEMRHVFDFATIGQTLVADLDRKTKDEMINFVKTELLTKSWMRAQSLSDVAAASSDRPDHGPMGAFSAWPAETTAVFCTFGNYGDALDLLHRVSAVTSEGPFSQSRELMGKDFDSPVKIAERGDQTYNVSSGGSFADAIIINLFGFAPDFTTTDFRSTFNDKIDRGFKGQLLNIRFHGGLYDLSVDGSGRRAYVSQQQR